MQKPIKLIFLFCFLLLGCYPSSLHAQFQNNLVTQSMSSLFLCEGSSDSLRATIANVGTNQIDSFLLAWEVNAVTDSAWFYVPLDTLNGANLNVINVAFDVVQMQSIGIMVKVWSKWPNGLPDANPSNDTAIYMLNPLPKASINDAHICEGDSITLYAGVANASYVWNNGSTDSILVIDSARIVAVTVTDFFGCVTADTAIITQSSKVTLPDTLILCENDTVKVSGGISGGSYVWSSGSADSTIQVTNPGYYSVTLTDQNCISSDSIYINEVLNPIAAFSDSTDYFTVVFTNHSQNADSFLWNFGDGSSDTVENPIHIYPWTSVSYPCYSVKLIAENQCGIDSVLHGVYTYTYNYYPDNSIKASVNGWSVSFSIDNYYGAIPFWDFGDGDTITSRNPTHLYSSSSQYECYQVSVSYGCDFDTAYKKVGVGNYPASDPCDVIDAVFELRSMPDINVYPIPAKDELNLTVQNVRNGSVEVGLFNIGGVEIYHHEFYSNGADFRTMISVKDFSKGIYLLKVVTNNNVFFQELVIL